MYQMNSGAVFYVEALLSLLLLFFLFSFSYSARFYSHMHSCVVVFFSPSTLPARFSKFSNIFHRFFSAICSLPSLGLNAALCFPRLRLCDGILLDVT